MVLEFSLSFLQQHAAFCELDEIGCKVNRDVVSRKSIRGFAIGGYMNTPDLDLIYRQIKNKVATMITEPWKKIYVYIEVEGNLKRMFFYYEPINMKNHYIYFTDISGKFDVLQGQASDTILEIYKIINRLYEKCKDNLESWTNLTLTFYKNNIETEFDLFDLSDTKFEQRKATWETKYLS